MNQLSFFPELETKERTYIRDRKGRFTTLEQHEIDEVRESALYFKEKYEAERRKLKPLIKRLVEAERELNELRTQIINL